ncbi:hypothetical protein [Nitrosovibrio sp. Nv4]|uniref:hypothetical protein n=1 Tax=Nitrosovibrio sp. Nv4 TaxID=1945880 RepID=UPI000D46376F|nr:hypothetical protein [Nitrosovibrio sp. Nv4]
MDKFIPDSSARKRESMGFRLPEFAPPQDDDLFQPTLWIPAFAGMTGLREVRVGDVPA